MKKLLAIFIVSIVAVLANSAHASAQTSPQNYTTLYSHRFVYSSNPIVWEFSGLDTTATYVWELFTASESSGDPVQSLGSWSSVGSATAAFSLGAGVNGVDWPEDYNGPLVMVDNFGNTVSRHFLAQRPTNIAATSAWETDTANTLEDDKQVAGVNSHDGACFNPAYGPENPDGWHHTYIPCSVQVQRGEFFIYHYRVDAADYSLGHMWRFYDMDDTVEQFAFEVDEVIDCNEGGWSTGITALHTESFIVVNTNGENSLEFMEENPCLVNFQIADNPYTHTWDHGAFNYIKETSGAAHISDGESILLVSNKKANLQLTVAELGSLQGGSFSSGDTGSEWVVNNLLAEAPVSTTQTVAITQATEEIWNAYHGGYLLQSVILGTLDTDIYLFTDERFFSFTVPSSVGADIVEFQVTPGQLPNANVMTTSDAVFSIFDSYNTITTGQFTENVNEGLEFLSLDSPLGLRAIFIGTIMIAIAATGGFAAAFGLSGQAHFLAQIIIYGAVGGFWLMFGVLDQLTIILYLMSLAFAIAIFWISLGGSRDNAQIIE